MSDDLRTVLAFAHQLAWQAGKITLRYFQSDPIIEELQALQLQVATMRQRLEQDAGQYYGIGKAPLYRKACTLIDKAAPGKASVLLLGETGVGKEVMARSLHLRSERAGGPFVALNCAAIPPDLIEAEQSYKANAVVFETGADMWEMLMSIKRD